MVALFNSILSLVCISCCVSFSLQKLVFLVCVSVCVCVRACACVCVCVWTLSFLLVALAVVFLSHVRCLLLCVCVHACVSVSVTCDSFFSEFFCDVSWVDFFGDVSWVYFLVHIGRLLKDWFLWEKITEGIRTMVIIMFERCCLWTPDQDETFYKVMDQMSIHVILMDTNNSTSVGLFIRRNEWVGVYLCM